jgi:hypothetical protein
VAPEHDALGQRVRDDQQPFERYFPYRDRAADRDRPFGLLRTASGVLERISPSNPAVLMRSPTCSAWADICVEACSLMSKA